MWTPIEEYDSDTARRLCEKLLRELRRIEGAHRRATTTREISDMDAYNEIYMGIQSRVSRIISIRSFFTNENDRIGLDNVVTRARQELSFCRPLKAEHLTRLAGDRKNN